MFKYLNDAYPPGFICNEQDKASKATTLSITSDKAKGDWLGQHTFPKMIAVHARVTPIAIANKSVKATLRYDEETLPATTLYQSNADCEYAGMQIKLLSLEKIKLDESSDFVKGDQLFHVPAEQTYTRNFVHQKIDVLEHFTTGNKNSYLWGFGGFYRPGCKLNEMEQILFSLGAKNMRTQLGISRTSNWRKKGLDINLRIRQAGIGKQLEKAIHKHDLMTLADNVTSGDVKCILALDDESLTQAYKSYNYETISSNKHNYLIHFKKEEK